MNQSDILKLAKEAVFVLVDYSICLHVNGVGDVGVTGKITRFAELVAQHVNEERKKKDELILEALNAAQDEYSDAAKAYLIKTATEILEARTK